MSNSEEKSFYQKNGEIFRGEKRLTNCILTILYTLVDDTTKHNHKRKHRIEITHKDGKRFLAEFTIENLIKIDGFKTILAHHNGLFFGRGDDLAFLIEYLLQNSSPEIRELKYLGYDEQSKSYVFDQFLYDLEGKRHQISQLGYFEDQKLAPFLQTDPITATFNELDVDMFIDTLYGAWSNKGFLALGYYISTLFSHIIFAEFQSFPFLSLHGKPATGKSALILLLNRCFFVDWEGISMTKQNTAKGELRRLAQKSNLVTPLLEGRKNSSRFDYEGILPLYNRNSLYTRAETNQNNTTHDLQFKGSVSFVQNNEPFESKQAKQRIISIHFDSKDLSSSYQSFQDITEFTLEQLASIGHFILKNRRVFEQSIIQNIKDCKVLLKSRGVTIDRIAYNHAVSLAGIDILLNYIGSSISKNVLRSYTANLAKTKTETARNELPLADLFFDCLRNVQDENNKLLLAKSKQYAFIKEDNSIFINLANALWLIESNGGRNINKTEIQEQLKKHDNFEGSHKQKKVNGYNLRHWVFSVATSATSLLP